MENSLRLAQAKLAEASRISTVAELTASVAHEISQPLSGIIANAQACLRYLGAKPIDEELLSTGIQRILRDGRDASQTVRNVRALFRRKHPEAQPIDLQQLVQEVLLLHEARIRELGITVKVEVGKDVPSVPADRLQIQQLLANLIRNAIESMEFSPKAARELDVQVLNGTDMVVVAIADTGMGLSNPEKLFDPFFTTKHSGMGMGLRICKTIVEAHEGKLWADARPTRGATFTFSLPLERGAV
jgi:signal transduction histidine kinase